MLPTLVLTRPAAQSRALAAIFGDRAQVIVAPVMEIVATGEMPDPAGYGGVILTSVNAVVHVPRLDGLVAHCVGKRTAEAARAAGAEIGEVAENADVLVGALVGAHAGPRAGSGPLLHLRGEHARGSIAARLGAAGRNTDEVTLYRQEARGLSAAARAAIEGAAPAILPLYSPRSARLVGAGIEAPGRALRVIAMSPAVAEAWGETTGGSAEVCDRPTGAEMRARIEAALRA